MQKGKVVLVERSNGSYRHYRYSDWQRFLLGRRAAEPSLALHANKREIVSIEIDAQGGNSSLLTALPAVRRRVSQVDKHGLFMHCELNQLVSQSFSNNIQVLLANRHAKVAVASNVVSKRAHDNFDASHTFDTSHASDNLESNVKVSVSNNCAAATLMLEDYIEDLLQADQKTLLWEQCDAFDTDTVVVASNSRLRCA